MIDKLGVINNLPALLLKTEFDVLNNEIYFSNFNDDPGDGYIGNNFGQDLRNFKRFILYARENGAKTVWFSYG